jgi:hypothetical protein
LIIQKEKEKLNIEEINSWIVGFINGEGYFFPTSEIQNEGIESVKMKKQNIFF